MKNNVTFDSTLAKFGIGLFETIKITNQPVDLEYHMDRLFNSMKELEIISNLNREELEDEILNYIKINQISNKALRLTVCDEGFNISTRDIPYKDETYKRGFKINISPIKRGESLLYKHKTTNYFENIYTKTNANKNGFDDGLFISTNNTVLECSMSNIFFIKDGILYTPKKDLQILNGTKKKRILEVCEELNIIVKECEIKLEDLSKFDFVFISNSLMNVMRVTQIEKIKYKDSDKLFEKIEQLL